MNVGKGHIQVDVATSHLARPGDRSRLEKFQTGIVLAVRGIIYESVRIRHILVLVDITNVYAGFCSNNVIVKHMEVPKLT